jgi:hypothetical protein
MAKYLFVYHGGSKPETESEVAEVMDAWGNWFGPASGYSLIEASDLDDAVTKAKGCPILGSGGSVELAEAFDM